MSRIGKNPVPVPDKVTVSLDGLTVKVKGPKGELERTLPDGVSVSQDNNCIVVAPSTTKRFSRERHGLCRTLVANMIEGVNNGYSKSLESVGVGSRAQVKGKTLVVSAGYSHPVEMDVPQGLSVNVENNTSVTITGADKQLLGQFAAEVRAKRPPEPFKGKGVKYADEYIVRKEGKKK